MGKSIKAHGSRVRSMDQVRYNFLMAAITRDNFTQIKSMEEVSIIGLMRKNTRDNGNTTKCLELGSLFGRVEMFMKVNFRMENTKDMAL